MSKNVPAAVMQAAVAASKATKKADEKAAAEFAADYIEIKPGVRLYRPKVAHQWLISYLNSDAAVKKLMANSTEMVILVAYALAHTQATVRNRLLREARQGKFADAAWLWLQQNDLAPDEVSGAVTELWHDIRADGEDEDKEADPGEGSAAGGGAD